jgi:SAM-dependent methyltransferase
MSVFGNYSRYYNLLYKDKDYQGEVDFVAGLLAKHSGGKAKSVLDIGCGTGNHDLLLCRKGFSIDGVDRSEEMVSVARRRAEGVPNARFHQGDATSFRLDAEFDAVISLFHVMSYLTDNAALFQAFGNAHRHLKPGGIFLFDFWYGPGVLTDRPAPRIKRMEGDGIRVHRMATPEVHAGRDIVDVNYEVLIQDLSKGTLETLKETHHMRYLFRPEIEFMLGQAGFRLLDFREWMTDREPGFQSWNAYAVAVK